MQTEQVLGSFTNRYARTGIAAVVVLCVLLAHAAADPGRVNAKHRLVPTRLRTVQRASVQGDDTTVTQDGWTLRSNCDRDCTFYSVDGEIYEPPASVVASPGGTTYSVHHQVGADFDGKGPDPETCFIIASPNATGDDIVLFDGVVETTRQDLLGTVPSVRERDEAEPGGSRFIQIITSSPTGTDLFPGSITFDSQLLTDACFTIGIHDPLDWEGLDTIAVAEITFFIDGQPVIERADVTSFFTSPWNGFVSITLVDGAGMGINGVTLDLLTTKQINLPNDDCLSGAVVTDGTTLFSTIGASTDGEPDVTLCLQNLFDDIGSDIWYEYTATCTGELTVDLCDSSYDTKVAVYEGCGRCPPETPPIACNDDLCSLRSKLGRPDGDSVPVVEGSCYRIRVGGYQGFQGDGIMRLSCAVPGQETAACCVEASCVGDETASDCTAMEGTWFPDDSCPTFTCPSPPPKNDECEKCIRVFTGVPLAGTSVGSTGTDISACGTPTRPDSNDVWHCWTADCTGLATFKTCGSSFDTTLAVYDTCGGTELDCDDDFGCPTEPENLQSVVEIPVTEGTTYSVRIAGYDGAWGDYTLTVDTCKSACCAAAAMPVGCAMTTPVFCENAGGTPQAPGSVCLGDNDSTGVDDVCEGCPQATIANSEPFHRTVDARQPHESDAAFPRQGIGSADEVIFVLLSPRISDAAECFSLCETLPDPDLGANAIASVNFIGNGVYEIVLNHAIPAGGVTTIEYLGDGSTVEYTAHPANVDGGPQADADDVLDLQNCCLKGTCIIPWGARSCDVDRSSLVTPLDILTAVDLLNGSDLWVSWNDTAKPANTSCP